MNPHRIWKYLFFLGIAITAIGLLSSWWCSGHHAFTCTNGLGISWHTTFNFKLLKFARVTPALGVVTAGFWVSLVWIEIKRPQNDKRTMIILTFLLFLTCVFAVGHTLYIVREANHCEFFTAWTTELIDGIFPAKETCHLGITWITDVANGMWITLLGSLSLLILSFVKPHPAIEAHEPNSAHHAPTSVK